MVTGKFLVFEMGERGTEVSRRISGNSRQNAPDLAVIPPQSSKGVVVKSTSYPAVGSGLLLAALSGVLVGQIPAPTQSIRGTSAAAETISSVPPTPAGSRAKDDSFVIGNDDVLSINVWKEPDFSQKIQVRSDGRISLPLVGEIQATGLTPFQLEQDLTEKLRNYITKPKVTVMVEQINSKKFNILGQVTKPGSYSLAFAPTIVDAIAISGGLRDFAKQKSIYILRENPGGPQIRIAFNYKDFLKGKNQNIKLEPLDIVVVP
jgi:polysaccharide biosynthesis/export protein